MQIFIDFDDVIFNTKKFKHDFKEMFLTHGISSEIFDKYYNDPNDIRAIKTFDPWKQIERINEELGIDTDKLTQFVDGFIADISEYVFEDVEEFAGSVGAGNICVVSFGEREFQTKKIENSKINNFIKDIVVTEESKADAINEIIEKENVKMPDRIFFLDDRIEQIREVKERFPRIISILVKRPEGRYQEMQKEGCCDHEVHNLKEAREIIELLH